MRLLVLLAFLLASPAAGATIRLEPVQDNTIYESAEGTLSNGTGTSLLAGRTNQATDSRRRPVLLFDVAGALPAGATVTSTSLVLHLVPSTAPAVALEVHALQAGWGEGTSEAAFPGQGSAATPGDVTWLHRFYPDQFWSAPGGDFDAAPVATTTVSTAGYYAWGPTQAMSQAVQSWLTTPSANHGWLLKSNETRGGTAKRFDSREAADPALRPRLIIDYVTPPREWWILY